MTRARDDGGAHHQLPQSLSAVEQEGRDEHQDHQVEVGVVEERDPFDHGHRVELLEPEAGGGPEDRAVEAVELRVDERGSKRRQEEHHLEVAEDHRREDADSVSEGALGARSEDLAAHEKDRAHGDAPQHEADTQRHGPVVAHGRERGPEEHHGVERDGDDVLERQVEEGRGQHAQGLRSRVPSFPGCLVVHPCSFSFARGGYELRPESPTPSVKSGQVASTLTRDTVATRTHPRKVTGTGLTPPGRVLRAPIPVQSGAKAARARPGRRPTRGWRCGPAA